MRDGRYGWLRAVYLESNLRLARKIFAEIKLTVLSPGEYLVFCLVSCEGNKMGGFTNLGTTRKCTIMDLFPLLGFAYAMRRWSVRNLFARHEVRHAHNRCLSSCLPKR